MSTERRVSDRVETEMPAWLRATGRTFERIRVLDIGSQGIRLELNAPLKEEQVQLTLKLADNEHLAVTAKPVWQSKAQGRFTAGFRFAELPAASARQLSRWFFQRSLLSAL